MWRREAGRAFATAELAEAAGRRQFTVGTAAGIEEMACAARALEEASPNLAMVVLGAKSAFCAIGRAARPSGLERSAPELLRCRRSQ